MPAGASFPPMRRERFRHEISDRTLFHILDKEYEKGSVFASCLITSSIFFERNTFFFQQSEFPDRVLVKKVIFISDIRKKAYNEW